ncbi:MAG: hypothetical protein MUO85_03810, partial [candidate division Zixibacteria bacterium]|nr:hypothetical protein [candidate division Zixibacteria bacterium]
IPRPFDKLKVLSEVEAQTQDGEQSRTINRAPTNSKSLSEQRAEALRYEKKVLCDAKFHW